MPASRQLMAFAGTAFVIIVIPGPSVLVIVGRALAGGRRLALVSVLGNTLGEYVQVVAGSRSASERWLSGPSRSSRPSSWWAASISSISGLRPFVSVAPS